MRFDAGVGGTCQSRCHRAEFKGQEGNKYLKIAAEQTECPDSTVGTMETN